MNREELIPRDMIRHDCTKYRVPLAKQTEASKAKRSITLPCILRVNGKTPSGYTKQYVENLGTSFEEGVQTEVTIRGGFPTGLQIALCHAHMRREMPDVLLGWTTLSSEDLTEGRATYRDEQAAEELGVVETINPVGYMSLRMRIPGKALMHSQSIAQSFASSKVPDDEPQIEECMREWDQAFRSETLKLDIFIRRQSFPVYEKFLGIVNDMETLDPVMDFLRNRDGPNFPFPQPGLSPAVQLCLEEKSRIASLDMRSYQFPGGVAGQSGPRGRAEVANGLFCFSESYLKRRNIEELLDMLEKNR